ncbi:Radical SAM superfamily enzyme, MoaA/NifB/PqqE/SkfB family [Desulfopila aestuarii DSM 18488]|uniref:Radical SAM superfamily enzyme, MoaA/NifB/PqqE/SkfB family n=2 Tax=Desulfopila aestuarii TaxID=231440 RepID=A0A1M7Y3I5_9BACT|nr:Radical SAM superfamily enzyme, MoaA/NifB/PqqE/SkfB family [Desulfopila aestuarii DSM 18488]
MHVFGEHRSRSITHGNRMKRFKKIYIEITNTCNLCCNFCPGTHRPPELMDEERFQSIITAITPYTDYVFFHLMGEPLFHPGLPKFLEMSHQAGLKVNITTNGTLLERVQAVLLQAPALRQVNISLSSFEANVMTRSLELYLTTVVEFVKKAARDSGIICSIRLWNIDSEHLKGSNRLNEQILRFLEACFGMTQGSLSMLLKNTSKVLVKERVYLNPAEKFEWPDLNKTDGSNKVFCHGLRDQMGVLVDGTVVPCCLDCDGNIPLGNMLNTSLEDILHSERAVALFNGFSRRYATELLCQKCGYARRY